jgi:hypothetical protein
VGRIDADVELRRIQEKLDYLVEQRRVFGLTPVEAGRYYWLRECENDLLAVRQVQS